MLLFALAPLAAAAEPITDTGLPGFDPTFAEAREVLHALEVAELTREHALGVVVHALELPEATSMTDAMAALGAAATSPAGAGLRVDTAGGVPTLVPIDALPDEVWAAVTVTNRAATEVGEALAAQREILGGARSLVDASVEFKKTLGANMLHDAGIEPTKLPKITKLVRENAEVIGKIPGRVDGRIQQLDGFLGAIRDIPQP